jgi:hypothetical protein
MYQLTQLGAMTCTASGWRTPRRSAPPSALALARATRRAERAERRMRRAACQARRLRAQLQAQTATDQCLPAGARLSCLSWWRVSWTRRAAGAAMCW